MINTAMIESHPFPPFYDSESEVLIMGTFPPQPKRWSMNFYYPNRTNDFWPMMGLIFYGDKKALYDETEKNFDLDKIKKLLHDKHIALNDTGHRIRRLKDNASDKFLEILEPVNLYGLLGRMPKCRTIVTTGEKAAEVVAALTNSEAPRMGESIETPDGYTHWRMPSTSRAYPLALEKKAAYYARVLKAIPKE